MRLKEALPHIVHPDQTCGILGRSIFENLYTIRDIITYAGDHKIPAYIVSLDFQKAFDKVDHTFLVKTLNAFGFGAMYRSGYEPSILLHLTIWRWRQLVTWFN